MMLRQAVAMPMEIRNDPAGSGHFGASRGARTHEGVDRVCTPGALLLSPVQGKFTKYGYAYKDDLQWRYIEITGGSVRHRFFYCHRPFIPLDGIVRAGDPIGVCQDITERYPGDKMLPHVHYEILKENGTPIDPMKFSYLST